MTSQEISYIYIYRREVRAVVRDDHLVKTLERSWTWLSVVRRGSRPLLWPK